jgi:hypothetical protein
MCIIVAGNGTVNTAISVVFPSGQKLNLGLLATITLKLVIFCAYAPLSALLPFLKCILEVVFCEDVQHRLRICVNHLNCVKMAAFQFYLQSGETEKSWSRPSQASMWVGDDSCCFWSKILW